MNDHFPIIEVPADAARDEEAMGSKSKFWYKDTNLGDCLFKRSRRLIRILCKRSRIPILEETASWYARRKNRTASTRC